MIVAFCLLATRQNLPKAVGIGLLLGYAITVRPAYGPGIMAMLVTYAVLKRSLHVGATALTTFLYLAPTLLLCHSQFGVFSVQAPATFSPLHSAQMGFRGARVLWFRPELAEGTDLPILSDPFLRGHFFDACKLESILGWGDSSLVGCLLSRPLDSLVFFGKKWIGLFDQFQLQPYAETITPSWYTWISRCSAALALWGEFILLYLGVRWGLRWLKDQKMPQTDPLLAMMVAFVAITTLSQLLLHVENRYSLVWIPYCVVALVWRVSRLSQDHTRARWTSLGVGAAIVAVYFVQVLAWDAL